MLHKINHIASTCSKLWHSPPVAVMYNGREAYHRIDYTTMPEREGDYQQERDGERERGGGARYK